MKRSRGAESSPVRRRCPSRCARSKARWKTDGGVPAVRHAEIERVFREQYGRAVAVLARVFGDIGLAEEAVQDAFTTALASWPGNGPPPAPAGWIITTARNRAIDRLRRESSRDDVHAQAMLLRARDEPREEGPVRDD